MLKKFTRLPTTKIITRSHVTMRQLCFFRLRWSILLFAKSVFCYYLENETFVLTWNREVEEKFKKFHLNLDELATKSWPLAENLTTELLEKVCNDVMIDRCPPWEPSIQWIKAYVPPKENELRERVTKYAEVLFQEGRKNVTLIRCVYKFFDFFLADGDNDHIFKLNHDLVDKVWTFDLGPFHLHR